MLILFVLHRLLLLFRSIDDGEQPDNQQGGKKDDKGDNHHGGKKVDETGFQNK